MSLGCHLYESFLTFLLSPCWDRKARGDEREASACSPQPWEAAVIKLLPWRGDLCFEGGSFHKSSFSHPPQSQEGLFLGFSVQEPGSPLGPGTKTHKRVDA